MIKHSSFGKERVYLAYMLQSFMEGSQGVKPKQEPGGRKLSSPSNIYLGVGEHMPAASHRGGQRQLWEFVLSRVESKNQPPVVMLGDKHLNTTNHLRDFCLSLKSGTSPHPTLENDHSEEVQERPVWASSPQLLTTWPLTVFHNNHRLEFSLLPTHQVSFVFPLESSTPTQVSVSSLPS